MTTNKAFWVEFFPINPATGLPVRIRICTLNTAVATGIDLANGEWMPYMTSFPDIEINVFSGTFDGMSQCTVTGVEASDTNGFGSMFTSCIWDGTPVTVYRGSDSSSSLASLTKIFSGSVTETPSNEDAEIKWSISDRSYMFDVEALKTTFAGSGGYEGTAEMEGVPKPFALGEVLNLEPFLVDPAYLIYQYHGYGRTIGVQGLYENGLGFGAGQTPVAWAGSVEATFAALRAVELEAGEWVDAPSIGMFRLGGEPLQGGLITCDVKGQEKSAGVLCERLDDVLALLVEQDPNLAGMVDGTTYSTVYAGSNDQTVGDYFTGSINIGETMAKYLAQCGAYYFVSSEGFLRFGFVRMGTPALEIRSDGTTLPVPEDVSCAPVSAPYKRMRMGADKVFRVHNLDEISDALYQAFLELENRPVTNIDVSPPSTMVEGGLWFSSDGHPYRFGRRPWVGADGNAWVGADGEPWLGSGYSDAQDQLGVQAMAAAEAVTAQVARIASDGWLTAGEKSGLTLSHKAMIENHIALDAKAAGLGVAATERTNATNAVNALNAYLTSLSPAWNDTTQDTQASAASITGLWGDAAQKVALLQAAVQGLPGPQGDPGTNGIDGIDGDDGKLVEFVWKRAASQPAAPTGNGIPSGWSDDPPAGSDPLWISKAKQELDGALVAGESWSTPIRHDGPPGISPVSAVAVPASKQFTADSDGVVKTGQLPFNFAIDAIKAGEPIGGTVSVVSVSGCTATAISGGFTIDTISADAGFVQWKIVATDGQEVIGKVSFSRQRDPASGGSVLVNFSSTSWWGDGSYAASGPTTVLPASSIGKLRISGYASFYSATNGTATLTAKLQYREVGSGTWIDSGFSATGNAFKSPDLPGEPGENSPGDVFPNGELTGLTADAPYEIQLVGNRSTSGTAIASATGFVSMTQVLT